MRALRITAPGGPEVLSLIDDAPSPTPGVGQVRVRVAAVGLNRADCLQRRGVYPAPPGVPADIPGLELSGVIDAVGEQVIGWAPGEEVMAIVAGGACAEQVVLHHRELIPIPRGLSLLEAAAIPEAFLTAWDALTLQGDLRAGQRVLIQAAGSGVGTAALQLVQAAGGVAIGASRTPEKLERCRELGLAHAVRADDTLAAQVRAVAPEGVDLALELVGASTLEGSLKSLRRGGAVVVVGLVGGATAQVPLGLLLSLRARLIGTVLRSRPLEEKIALAQRFAREVVPQFERGLLRPVLDAVLPMEEAAEAHRQMEANTTFGKLVLVW